MIEIMFGFLQNDSYSSVGFWISEIPVCKLLHHCKGYRIGEPGNRNVKLTHSLLVDDLNWYRESYKALKDENEINVQIIHDTGPWYGVKKLQITCYLAVNVMWKVYKADRILYGIQWL